MLRPGDPAPDFSLPDQDGITRSLRDYRGRWLLVYFYPKDDTPGCTTEACGIRDRIADFGTLGMAVVGISADSVARHGKFAAKHGLPFPLLSDPEHAVIEAYGAWRPKRFMGRSFLGIARISFLIDPEGRIAKAYETVKPATHADEVLSDTMERSSPAHTP